ncbi:hypothetical protein ABK040_009500 [Willaertia magna]
MKKLFVSANDNDPNTMMVPPQNRLKKQQQQAFQESTEEEINNGKKQEDIEVDMKTKKQESSIPQDEMNYQTIADHEYFFDKYKPFFNSKESLIYTHCYCEENIYKLCEGLSQKEETNKELDNCYVVFISSLEERVPMWFQSDDNQLVVWDYHVIFIHKPSNNDEYNNSKSMVYDFDIRLDFPIDFPTYFFKAFMTSFLLEGPPKNLISLLEKVQFRIIPAKEYLTTFSSDRSHMLGDDGKYLSPPPIYKCICGNKNTKMNLDEFRKMDIGKKEQVYSIQGFTEFFGVNYEEMKNWITF